MAYLEYQRTITPALSTATWTRPGSLDVISYLLHAASVSLMNSAHGAARSDQCLRLLASRCTRPARMLSYVSLTARASILAAICLQANQDRVEQIIQGTYMRTTRENGRTTRMLKIGRYNGAHAKVCRGRKKNTVSRN